MSKSKARSSRRRKVHLITNEGDTYCHTPDADVTDDWSLVTCLWCTYIIDRLVDELSADPVPFEQLNLWYIWRDSRPSITIPARLLEANQQRQRDAEVAFARAVLDAYERGDALPSPGTWASSQRRR